MTTEDIKKQIQAKLNQARVQVAVSEFNLRKAQADASELEGQLAGVFACAQIVQTVEKRYAEIEDQLDQLSEKFLKLSPGEPGDN